MTHATLTDMTVRKLVPKSGERVEVFDSRLPGFAVRVFPSGVKSFILFYRHDGKQRRVTLGRYPVLSLSDARRMAMNLLNKSAQGEDPQPPPQERPEGQPFTSVVEEFARLHCAQHNRPRTAEETERILRKSFVSAWGNTDLKAIEKGDVIAILDDIVGEGKASSANHALASIRKLFNWCVARDLISMSPCAGIARPAATPSRERVLSDDELCKIWRATDIVGYPFEAIIKLLVLTGQRRGEVAGMLFQEVDLDQRVWSIPAERTKSNREQILPLSASACSVLRELPRLSDDLVFPALGRESGSFSGFSKSKHRLDAASGVASWTLHDIRRTVATGLARLGIAPHVVERILNHTSYTLGGVAGIYNRFGYLPEMRAALDQWSSHVERLVATRPDIP